MQAWCVDVAWLYSPSIKHCALMLIGSKAQVPKHQASMRGGCKALVPEHASIVH